VTSPDELLRLLNVDADEKLLAGVAGGDDKLLFGGKYLTKQRIVRVAFLHSGNKRARELANVVTSPDELLRLLNVDADEKLLAGHEARRLFKLRYPIFSGWGI
jgi:hypothetical protein